MTEVQWLASQDPAAMMRLLDPSNARVWKRSLPDPIPSDRKLRLFACAVGRHHIAQHGSPALRSIEVTERSVELGQYDHNFDDRPNRLVNQWWAVCRSTEAAQLMARHYPGSAVAPILREVVGNPHRPITPLWVTVRVAADMSAAALEAGASEEARPVSPWLTPQVLSLAEAAYAERLPSGTLDPFRLALLADALEEAGHPPAHHQHGFSDSNLLDHLRSTRPHYRGCWAADLVLGKV